MTETYGHEIAPQPLSVEDYHHGFVSLNLIGTWDDWIKRRVESIQFESDMTVRRRVSVDFRLRTWLPEPILTWNGQRVHYIPIALLNKEPLLSFDLNDETGRAVPLLTRKKNAAIAAASLVAMAQLSVWTRLGIAVGFDELAKDGSRPPNPRRIRLPREIEDTLVRIAYLPYEAKKGAKEFLTEFLAADLSSQTPLSEWKWKRVEEDDGETYWEYDDGSQWRYELARDRKMRTLLGDLAELWMVAIPVVHEPGRRRIIKFCYSEHRLEPQLRLTTRIKGKADRMGAGSLLGRLEDSLEGLPRADDDTSGWDRRDDSTHSPHALSLWTKISQALGWQGHLVKFDVPAVGKGGSYHLDLTAPEGTQIRQATLGAASGDTILDSQMLRGARGLLNAHLYVGNLPSGVQGEASVTLKPRTTTIVRSLALLAIASLVMLAMARWKLGALTDRKHGTSGSVAPIFLLFPGLGAALVARGAEHSMTTSMLFGLRLLAVGVAVAPLTGASLLAIARRWPHLGLVWWGLVIWSALLTVLLLVSWRLAGRRRPDGGAP
jgi:hypothetical protein